MKDFDFKGFLIQRGELVGLGLAVLLAAVLLFTGSKGFFAGSASATAQSIEAKRLQASKTLEDSQPPANIGEVSNTLLRSLDDSKIDPTTYELVSPFVTSTPVEDTKRRNPEVMTLRDLSVIMLRAVFPGYLLTEDERQIAVVKGEGIATGVNQNALGQRFGGRGGAMSGFGPGGSDDGGPGDGGGAGNIGGTPPGGEFGKGETAGGLKRNHEMRDVEKLGNLQNAKFAEQIYPYHVAVVSGAFPFKQQLENFRRSLARKGTMNDLFAAIASNQVQFQFVGLDIQRRVTLPSGRVKDFNEKDQGWKDFNADFRGSVNWLYRRTPRFEPEEPRLLQAGLIREGLVMARPAMARGLKYPTKELEIPSVKKSLEDIEKALAEKNRPIANPVPRRFDKTKDFDPFSANPLGGNDPNQGGTGFEVSQPPKSGEGTVGKPAQDELLIPEYVLVRFLDLTVQPNHSYEYRVRIKMANPNYGKEHMVVSGKLAKQKELTASEWAGTEGSPSRVPDSLHYYAVDEKNAPGWAVQGDVKPPLNNTPFQIHRWLANLPGDRQAPIGNWVINERALIHRGEYVGRAEEPVELPLWDFVQERDVLAASRKVRTQQRVPVDFRVRMMTESRTAVLVDFLGGSVNAFRENGRQIPSDQSAVQALVMAPDGRLIVRNAHEDTNDETRKATHEQWREWIKATREGRAPSTGKPNLFDGKGALPRGGGNP